MDYQPDTPTVPVDVAIIVGAGSEPDFDAITSDFLFQGCAEIRQRVRSESLLQVKSLGQAVPWLYRLTFGTKGNVRHGTGPVHPTQQHVVALRFLPDYLQHADRFNMLRLVEPENCFHPNIIAGRICVNVYPGEPLTEICQSLHDLFRWRLRQYDERDALNPTACAWGRENIDQPVDDRPLFGKRLEISWDTTASDRTDEAKQ